MRILQISSARSIGGGERHVIDLANELARRGHDVFVAVVPGSPLPEALNEIPAHQIIELPLRNALDLRSAIRLARFAKKNHIELINAHFARDYPPTAIAAWIAKVPYVLTRHVLFPMKRMQRAVLRDARFVIAPSNAVADNLRTQGLFPPEKIVTIRYGLDVTRFPFVENGEHDEHPVVGSIGNLDLVKGFDLLIRAAAIVLKHVPEVRFRIVGDDRSRDGRNRTALLRLIDELGLTDVITLTGWSANIVDVFRGFDIFVSSSRSESFGFVIAEAMLCGVPVIATETQGAREIISDPAFGTLVPIGAIEELAAAIVRLIREPSERKKLTSSGRDHIARFFSVSRMVDETEELYRRAI